ncbi:NAD(P)-dependent dehydrogenase (short-subunit alcohol dehydrogenase family) [Prauserella shujinwangii]|uniref:NAD(P)-dependent dehydrogenase (Short-subunit alcohol dehydrogenase family) n=1 Tax=Prauserella shujinwangii TaxID=1453103 RepID=A0A2T0M1I5_9PSEU|nr:SDR family oxidoreductase [Prauserella shujinwangii]PRX50464.1 NAD(P)-dependent dehydrogenase (short-subunit alcohol dehydrogenase family) [Prauserella shujinwangii]
MDLPLRDHVAVVAGATRGCGRAIAVELGALGATVFAAGRSTRERRSALDRPETIEGTAERVSSAGGRGIPVRCDFLRQEDITALRDEVAARTGGHLDVLVDDVWGGDPLIEWDGPFWEQDLERAVHVWRNGLETHLRTVHTLLPLLVSRAGGLLVEVTDGVADGNSGSLVYDQVKCGVRRLASGLAEQLPAHAATSVAVTPGFLRSEAMLDHFGVAENGWRDAIRTDPHFVLSETPRYLGRGVTALAADPDRSRWNGQVVTSHALADCYDLTDVDGSRPDWPRWMREVVATGTDPSEIDVSSYR